MRDADILALSTKIYGCAMRLARQTHKHCDLQDMAQDAYLAIVKAAPRFDGRNSFNTFNYLRMRGAMIDGLRRWDHRERGGAPRVHWEQIPENAAASWPAETPSPERECLHRELHDALDDLPAQHQHVIRRFYFDYVPIIAIAEEMDLSESRIGQLKQEAIAALRGTFLREAA